jgi:hypothetical protein
VEPETKAVASYGTAAVLGAGAVYASVQARKKRASASIVDLYNTIVELPDPSLLSEADVSAVGAKYGVSMQKDELEGLLKIYGQFLEAVIPSGDTQLRYIAALNLRKYEALFKLRRSTTACRPAEKKIMRLHVPSTSCMSLDPS